MIKPRRYVNWCHIPILKGVLVVVCTDDSKWFAEKFNAEDLEDERIYAMTVHGEYKMYDAYIIVLNLWGGEKITHGVIMHEVNHAVNSLFINRDWVKLKNDEPESYVKEFVTNRVYQYLQKNKLYNLVSPSNANQ